MAITSRGRARLDELRIQQGLDVELPWGGRDPRVLTRGYLMLALTQRAAPLNRFCTRLVLKEFRRIILGG